jgi:Kef-type K+ transport system membrane component KefB
VENIWFQSALWMALALVAALGSLFITISAALFEIVVGALAGNTVGLPLTPWIEYIASFGAIVLTFLAGTDIDPHVVKRNFASRYFKFNRREGMYTTLMMSTGLTFGSISALFGLTNHIINQQQYTVLVTAVIGSAVVPTLIAQLWFHPHFEPLEEDA